MAGRKKILVVDDEADLRAIARLTLENAGYEVLQAENGKRGMEVLAKNKPDMVVLDLMMPEMNGIEFCRRMVEDMGMKDVPVLVLSAVNEKASIVKQFFEIPVAGHAFIPKPLEPEEVVAKVKELIGEPVSEGEAQTKPKPAAGPKPKAMPAGQPEPSSEDSVNQPAQRAEPSRPSAAPRAAAKEAAPSGPRLKILIIDDEEDIRALLKATLGLRHNVEEAENGMVALSIIDRVNPDFVISDVNMPVMNGMETVEAIRRHPKFGSIPVFFLTAEADTNLPRKLYDIGGNLYLRKPLDPMRLLGLIDRFVEEMELRPKVQPANGGAKPGAPPAGATTRPATGGGAGAVRLLTIDYNIEHLALLKRLFHNGDSRKCETLWAEEVRTALGNLGRWEPDVILYNPRNPGMDGIAFTQTLKLRKVASKYQLAFIGSSFFEADVEYSRKSLGREVIRLDSPEDAIKSKIFDIIEAARPHLMPKQNRIEKILSEDDLHKQQLKEQRNRADRQREIFKEKFSRIQTFIDKQQLME